VIVVDASVFSHAILIEGSLGARCQSALEADDRWIVPQHWTVEVLSVIRRNLLSGKITEKHAAEAVRAVEDVDPEVPLTRVLVRRIWELRGNLSSYDAAYVAAAEAYGCALVTADGRLSRAPGIRCALQVIT
jgi:predicted nucleic acid-binding protein